MPRRHLLYFFTIRSNNLIPPKDCYVCTDMRIVPVGSPGKIWISVFGSSKWRIEIGLLGVTFYQDFNLFNCTNEAKSWWQPQIEATYMRNYHGDSLICLASHLIKPKWGRSNNWAVTRVFGSSIHQGGYSGVPAMPATILMSAYVLLFP